MKIPPGEFPPEKFSPIKLSLGNPTRKITIQKILTWIIPTHFINCLSSLNPSFWLMFTNVKTSAIMKKKFRKLGWEYSRWEIFRSVFSRVGVYQRGVCWNFPGRRFRDTEKNICKEFSSVHALTLIFIRKIFILQTHSLRV